MSGTERATALADALDRRAADPALDPAIAPLVELAAAIAPPPAVDVDPAFRIRARVALVEAMHAEPAVTSGPLARSWRTIAGSTKSAVATRRFAMPALLVALLLLAGTGGVAVASQNAQPGDALYPVKIQVQAVQGAFAVPARRVVFDDETATATAVPTETTLPTATPAPTNTVAPTATTAPTDTPIPTATTAATPATVVPTAGVPTVMADLRSDVANLANDRDVPGRSEEGLLAKLRAAQAAIDRGQPRVAENILGAFDDELDAMHRAGHISQADFDDLQMKAGALKTGLAAGLATAASPTGTARPAANGEGHGREGKGPPSERPTPAPTAASTAAATASTPTISTEDKGRGNGRPSSSDQSGNAHQGNGDGRGRGR
jgi:hypothetical protein